ncbi:MAG: DUF3488 and transglutaminase-like domain-containing protein [Promethearchaeota archaeon]
MSPDQSKPEGNLKKQLLSLGIIVVLVIGGWYLSAVVTNLIFQQDKIDSVDPLDDAPWVDVDLDAIAPPNFTPPDDWSGFDPSLLDLLSGLPFLAGMFGNITDMDQLNTVVFRVYPQAATISDSDLWRYSAYDEYQGNGWARSVPATSVAYTVPITSTEDYVIRIPFGETNGGTVALPSGFSEPEITYVMAEDPLLSDVMNSYDLSTDSQNGTTVSYNLNTDTAGNLTYGLYYQPKPDEMIYNNGFGSSLAPSQIMNLYTQFPDNDEVGYYNDHPYFNTHVNNLSTLIGSTTDTYSVADIIRTYIVSNFGLDLTFPLERPGSGDDIVEWFLERGEGLPMDFAAVFVMFCRWFDIPCRYTAGYNSRYTSDTTDPDYFGWTMREIQMSNMDAWNEIYFVTDGFGNGKFAPFILSPSLTLPSGPDDPSDAQLNIQINGTYTTYSQGFRGFTAHLDFELGDVQSGTNATQELELFDHTEEVSLGSVWTDGSGYASYDVVMDSTFTAGAHFIGVQHTMFQQNACAVILADNVNIQMTGAPIPNSINRSITNDTHISAYIYDPINNNRVKNAILHPVIAYNTAAIPSSVIPSDIKVDVNGSISDTVTISEYVAQGIYDFRVDFNGTYEIINPVYGTPQIINIPLVNDASSNTYSFEIIDDNQKIFNMDVDSAYYQEDTFHKDRDTDSMTINIYLEQAGLPVVGGQVQIRDRTYDDYILGTITTFAGGMGSMIYSLASDYSHWRAGVHELYGYWVGIGRVNQSFYLIVDETMEIVLTSVTPSNINRTGGGQMTFDVDGYLWDSGVSDYVRYGYIGVQMWQGATDYTASLTGDPTYMNVGGNGQFSATYGVNPATPIGVYDIYVGFGGDWELTNSRNQFINDPAFTDTDGPEPLTINDPTDILIEMWIDYIPTQSTYYGTAPNYNRNDVVRIDVRVWEGLSFKQSATVTLRDETLGIDLGSTVTNSTGGASFLVTLDSTHVAGLNLLSVSHSTIKNYTQVFLDDTMYVDLASTPSATSIRDSGSVTISGYVRDSLNDEVVTSAAIQLYVRDFGGIDRTGDITIWLLGTPGSYLISDDNTGLFTFVWRMPVSFHGVYRITAYFTGDQQEYSIACPGSNFDVGLADLSSESLQTVYADVDLTATYSPQILYAGQPVYVDGTLFYDNGTAITGTSVIIKFYDSSDTLLYSDTDTTDGSGNFSYSTTVLWSVDTIYVEFVQDDINYIWESEVQATFA